jgi:hypothetical protein
VTVAPKAEHYARDSDTSDMGYCIISTNPEDYRGITRYGLTFEFL